ncbi:MAG: sensor histidine kinase [Desulfosarcina sp.]|nr:sensor histidine kinase [Desulfobacterales bacterium]
MRKPLYRKLQKRIIMITLLVCFIPLILLGGIIYYQFANVYKEKIEDQVKYKAKSESNAVKIFLKERTSILSTIVDTNKFDFLKQQDNLFNVFEVINHRADNLGIVDLGIIDNTGQQLAYAGPYNLKGLNYEEQPWFNEVMAKGVYISDVFMGFRKMPHFIIAVSGYDRSGKWILRATIDSDIFNRLVKTAQTGRTGDAYIINKEGIFQTAPRFTGKILENSGIDITTLGEEASFEENKNTDGDTKYYAGAWLKNNEWLLVISQETGREMSGLFATRNLVVGIILFGCLAIVITTVFTTRTTLNRLAEADEGISELNAQLIQSDKLAALGKMAAGIAHEVNNPLAVIGEKAGWMKDLLEDEEFQESENFKEYLTSIEKIEHHVERARKITHNMLGFARRMEPHLDDVDLNEILIQTVELLESHARINNIEIQKDLQEDLPVIASDQSQLQQVFMNLINNAIDAIGSNGSIEIKTSRVKSNLIISIKDNGEGISAEQQRKVFDPFFTTKAAGKGTGLGLSVSFSLIEKMGGTITFESKKTEGTTFHVTLPVVIPEKK